MHRFFVDSNCIQGSTVYLPDDVSNQASKVLRLRNGDQIIVLDNTNVEYLVTLDVVSATGTRGQIEDTKQSIGEPDVDITLYQGVLKSDKFEWVLQKGTELGISAFVPTMCERSIPRARDRGWIAGRIQRWQRIVKEAAEQSGRGRIPEIGAATSFTDACESAQGIGIIPWEMEISVSLKQVLTGLKRDDVFASGISVFIGPEGGFSEGEITHALSKDITPVSLGRRILRAETAGLATVAAVLYEFGEMGG